MVKVRYIAGARGTLPGTNLPGNVSGDCGHLHRSRGAAERCLAEESAGVRRYYGGNTYLDRSVVAVLVDGSEIIARNIDDTAYYETKAIQRAVDAGLELSDKDAALLAWARDWLDGRAFPVPLAKRARLFEIARSLPEG